MDLGIYSAKHISKRFICGILICTVINSSVKEILECPIHNDNSCQTQHIEQTYVSLATASPSPEATTTTT